MSGVDLAVIMAAGSGVRLGSMGRLIPKGFIRLGERPIVEESVLRLRETGVREVVIVTGHLSEQFEPLRERHPGLVRLVHNAGYERGGSFASLLCAVPHADRDFLLLESDIVYESRALDLLQTCGQRDIILTSGLTHAGDEVWVATTTDKRDATLCGMSKRREALGGHIVGELAGISRLSRDTLHALAAARDGLYAGGKTSVDYEDALVHVAPVTGIRVTRLDDLVWAEIDTTDMLERVQTQVYPRIAPVSGA